MNLRKIVVVFAVTMVWSVDRAEAVIKVEMPVSRIYGTSKAVYVGVVSKVTASNRLVDVKVTGTLRGESPGDSLRIQIVSPADLIGKVASDAPVMLFVGKARGGAMAVLHLADTWLLAKRAGKSTPQIWRVVQKHNAKQTFPGRTSALVRVVRQIAGGKAPILDSTDVAFFRSPIRKLSKLSVTGARWILATDMDHDRKVDLVVGTDKDVRLLLAGAEGYTDVTAKWGLKSGSVAYRAVVDVNRDRRPDLMLGDTIWINKRGTFEAVKLPLPAATAKDVPLGVGVIRVSYYGSSRSRPKLLFLTASGRLQVIEYVASSKKSKTRTWTAAAPRQLWPADVPAIAAEFGNFGDNSKLHVLAVRESGVTRYPLDAAGGAPADFERLTGVNLKKYYQRYAGGFKNPLVVALNVNGDHRRDLLIVCDTGGMLMVNRGYGTFLCDYDSGGEIATHPKAAPKLKLTAQTPWTAVDLNRDNQDDLLVLTADGTLYEVSNKPRPEPSKKNR
ncbi:MAG: VCBS repeat-containing protein [Phycisphaerae bacterium]|nr:VCBS repeat-containing protein [Phycisphaerae bacterium]